MLIWYPRLPHTGTFKETMKAFNEFLHSVSVVLSTLQICSLAGKFLSAFSASLTIESNPNNKVQAVYKQITVSKHTRTIKQQVSLLELQSSSPLWVHVQSNTYMHTHGKLKVSPKKKKNLSCLSCAFLFLMAFSLCESLGWLMGSCIVWTTLTSESSALQNALTRTHTHT